MSGGWGEDSNLRHTTVQAVALPTELPIQVTINKCIFFLPEIKVKIESPTEINPWSSNYEHL
jgi:hypothetical protein